MAPCVAFPSNLVAESSLRRDLRAGNTPQMQGYPTFTVFVFVICIAGLG
jgi:hypothetical protein